MRAPLVARTVALDHPFRLVDHLPRDGGFVWLHGDDGLVGWGEAARVDPGVGVGRFARAADMLGECFAGCAVDDGVGAPGCGPVAFGAMTFDWRGGGSALVVPRVLVGRRGGRAWRTTITAGEPVATRALGAGGDAVPPARVRYAGSTVPELRWLEAVAAAVERIRAGGMDKVVLARDRLVWSTTAFDPRVLLRRLGARFPDCLTFWFEGLVGATPELLVRRVGDAVESTVLAGSSPRGADPAADARLGAALRASDKDRREHALAVESVRAALAPRCARLYVDPRPSLLRLDNVQHLATHARGQLRAPATSLQLAGALHPTAAVCGAPTGESMRAIRALEGMQRGRYSGPVGWVDARGDGEWGVALRCAELYGARARMFAGAGIVDGSLPEAELEETRLKLRAMQSAFEGG